MKKIDYQKQGEWIQGHGMLQSPILLDPSNSSKSSQEIIEYTSPLIGQKLIDKKNNLGIESDGTIKANGRMFSLNEVHFHLNAEHQLKYESRPRALEMHFVFQDMLEEKLVVGVTFIIGNTNETIERLLSGMDSEFKLERNVNLSSLVPMDGNYYWYSGSLTTPPLTEGVEWIVYDQPLTISNGQLEHYRRFYFEKNARSTQPTNGRKIYLI
ncbi:carbonic anhydrase family protein [Pediococcus claussenii]|uniref:carbonic anhydrase n=1 Tax=Pediococcus claussenii (strain ATCC BAA-344 / DSM 14800 / JCM 18046 / KCTC 3811 / LMG 21948 / P06) TaxID=701521 RepID=G8PA61_PEDCP|nr:carbonic anhydrase family protein [Pediococcus claussenii]AEV94500.1 carbonic anhydrase [Pediococcus claussenii ATCC BAA-344]ANZ69717.1 hypothetical protein AYR57_05035 [Pediococcus claussenii]ANZ71534.1 hypothetical protein AYR58_05040 [Pediococcus claussenii]KRN19794.1 hypothetical protein IV79_GL001082 [Pediococcus claussenii]